MQQVIIRDSKDAQSATFQIRRADGVGLAPADMALTVKLDDKSSLSTIEIRNVRTDDMLAPELESTQVAVAKPGPKKSLRNWRLASQAA